MSITALPTPPLRSDPTNFAERGDAFLAALPLFVDEANATAAAMNLNSTIDTSASSVAIGTGAKTFVVSSGKSFQPGMYLIIADTAAPSTNSMHGQITSYSGTSLVVNVLSITGSGTKSAWRISQSSPGGAALGANNDITSLGALATIPTVIATAIAADAARRVGTVFHVPSTAVPSGALKLNGALLSRTTYAALWTYAQASGNIVADGSWVAGQFSTGDGSTTFRIPDARGEFVRGWDDGRGIDSGRGIGTHQTDALQQHDHATSVFTTGGSTVATAGASYALSTAGAVTGARTATETRPRNIALLACIWYQ